MNKPLLHMQKRVISFFNAFYSEYFNIYSNFVNIY